MTESVGYLPYRLSLNPFSVHLLLELPLQPTLNDAPSAAPDRRLGLPGRPRVTQLARPVPAPRCRAARRRGRMPQIVFWERRRLKPSRRLETGAVTALLSGDGGWVSGPPTHAVTAG